MGETELNLTKVFSRASFDIIFQEQVKDIGKQLQRLPNEIMDERFNGVIGLKYEDIIVSYVNMVEHLESTCSPYFTLPHEERPNSKDPDKLFQYGRKLYGQVIKEADANGLLLTKVMSNVDAEEGEED